MTELKAVHFMTHFNGEYEAFYPKADADKVIADKDAKILALDAEIFKQKHHAKLFFDERNYAETQLRRQKYKRCLAMARIAQDDWHLHNSFYAMGHQNFEKRKCEFYEKWHKRWLALAEEPTWAKFLQLIHKEAK